MLLAPISEVLSRLLVQVFTTAMAAKDVLIEQSNFNDLSRYLERITPVLRELQEKNVRDKPSIRSALESLEHVIKSANELISECTNKSRFSLLYNCRDIVKRLQDVTHEIGRCLSLIPMATLDISLDTRDQTVELCKLMQKIEFKAAVAEEEIIAKLDVGMREGQASRDSVREMLLQIAQVVGGPNNPASLQKELEKLKEEKEEALLKKSESEAIHFEQILGFLSQAETPRTESDHWRGSFGAQPLAPWQSFYCPITKEVMEDPVEIASGQAVERKAIEKWFSEGNKTCPITKVELESLEYQPNVALRNCIKDWRDRNSRIHISATKSKLQSGTDEDKLSALKDLHSFSEERPIHRVWIQEVGLIPIISSLLSSSNKHHHIRRTALATLRSLAADSALIKEEIAEAGAIQHAVRSLARDVKEGSQAVALLVQLSEEPSICERIGKVQGCILLLVTMSSSGCKEAAEDAKRLLGNLSNNNQNVVQMAEANYFKPLVHLLLEGPEMTRVLMASVLARMDLTDQSKTTIAMEGAIPPLVKMMSAGKLEAKTAALGALQNLSTQPENRDPMINAGVMPPLLQLLFSVTSVYMNLKEQAAETLANLATAGPMESTAFDSDETICQLLSLLNLVGPINQGHLLRALNGMASPVAASLVRAKMREGSAIQLLLPFCEVNDVDVRINAVKLLYSLSQDWVPEDLLDHFGLTYIQALVKLLVSSREDEKVAAAGIISNLPETDSRMTEMLRLADALPALVELLRTGGSKSSSRMFRDQLLETASRALRRFTLSTDINLQRLTAEQNAIPFLVHVLTVGSQLAKKEAATVLGQLSENSKKLSKTLPTSRGLWCFASKAQEGCKVHMGECSVKSTFCLVEAGAITPLVQVLEERESDAHEAALTALATLMKDEMWEKGVQVIAEAQGLKSIVRVLTVGTSGAKEKAAWMLERFFRVEHYRTEFGVQAQMPLIDLAQKGTLATRSLAAKGLAHLNILHNQSTYF